MRSVNPYEKKDQPPRQLNRASVIAFGIGLFLLPAIPSSQADFALNFTTSGVKNNNGAGSTTVSYTGAGNSQIACNTNVAASANCTNNIGHSGDNTPFFQDVFQDTTSGKYYYNVIIGDSTTPGFALQYIMQVGSTSTTFNSGGGMMGGGTFASSYPSSSAASTSQATYNMSQPYDVSTSNSLYSGTGTGNPTTILINQLIKDSDVTQIFYKDKFANKPLIAQTTTNGSAEGGGTSGSPAGSSTDMTSVWIADMRSLTYSNMNAMPVVATDTTVTVAKPGGTNSVTEKAGAAITNTVTLGGSQLAGSYFATSGDYNYATDNQNSTLTGGRYTYTAGTNYGSSNGTYAYIDQATGDTFQPANITYANFCDATQNVNWSGYGACKNGNGSGGGGGWGGSGMGSSGGGGGW